MCCSPGDRKESDMTQRLKINNWFFSLLGWPKSSFRFFIRWYRKNPNKLFGQSNIKFSVGSYLPHLHTYSPRKDSVLAPSFQHCKDAARSILACEPLRSAGLQLENCSTSLTNSTGLSSVAKPVYTSTSVLGRGLHLTFLLMLASVLLSNLSITFVHHFRHQTEIILICSDNSLLAIVSYLSFMLLSFFQVIKVWPYIFLN